jgi:hypothetical protein
MTHGHCVHFFGFDLFVKSIDPAFCSHTTVMKATQNPAAGTGLYAPDILLCVSIHALRARFCPVVHV